MRVPKPFVVIAALALSPVLQAEDKAGLVEVPEAAPPPPEPMQDGEALEPDVTIVQRKDATIEEYRLNGRLYMIKIVPVVGKPYYLMDKDGDGLMESRISTLTKDPIVPQWVIFSW